MKVNSNHPWVDSKPKYNASIKEDYFLYKCRVRNNPSSSMVEDKIILNYDLSQEHSFRDKDMQFLLGPPLKKGNEAASDMDIVKAGSHVDDKPETPDVVTVETTRHNPGGAPDQVVKTEYIEHDGYLVRQETVDNTPVRFMKIDTKTCQIQEEWVVPDYKPPHVSIPTTSYDYTEQGGEDFYNK